MMNLRCWQAIALVVCGLTVELTLAYSSRRAVACDEANVAYLGPTALAVSHDGGTLFVACADARQVAWVDVPAGAVTRRTAVPDRPTDIALTSDESKLIVCCAAPSSTVVVLDVATGELLDRIGVGHTSAAMAISPDDRHLYVCNRFDHSVSVVDLVAGKQCRRVAVGREPIAVAVTPDGQTVLVANHLPNMRTDVSLIGEVSPIVTILDTSTWKTTEIALPSGANALRGVCVSPDGKHALVTHLLSNFQMVPTRLETGWINTNVLSIIDIETRSVIATIGMDEMDLGAGNPWGVVCTTDKETICVSHAGTHEVSLIELSVLLSDEARTTMSPMMAVWPIYPNLGASLWLRVPLAGKGPRGLATAGTKIFVAEYFSDTVSVIDLAGAEAEGVRTLALGPPPSLTLQRRGELLFHDATICYQHWQSCASCHPEGRADALNWDLLNDGVGNPKNTKSMLLSHRTPPAMAEGVRSTAELAVRSGVENILFALRPDEETEAIDAYLKSLTPVPSPHLVSGRLTTAAQRGHRLFHGRRVACHRCHPAPLYTDRRRHNVGTRSLIERNEHFDTPTLVEVWRTAPYLHDGRYVTIRELLVEGRHGLSGDSELSDQEIDDLVEFVLSL